MRLRSALNRREQLGYNRHARVAVREYYGLPNAKANVANQLIDWCNGDKVGSLDKRNAYRGRVWAEWDLDVIYRRGNPITATEIGVFTHRLSHRFAEDMANHQEQVMRYVWDSLVLKTLTGSAQGDGKTATDVGSGTLSAKDIAASVRHTASGNGLEATRPEVLATV